VHHVHSVSLEVLPATLTGKRTLATFHQASGDSAAGEPPRKKRRVAEAIADLTEDKDENENVLQEKSDDEEENHEDDEDDNDDVVILSRSGHFDMPQLSFSHHTCAICLQSIKDAIILEPCHHVFCRPCISDWVRVCHKFNCPLCRSDFESYLGDIRNKHDCRQFAAESLKQTRREKRQKYRHESWTVVHFERYLFYRRQNAELTPRVPRSFKWSCTKFTPRFFKQNPQYEDYVKQFLSRELECVTDMPRSNKEQEQTLELTIQVATNCAVKQGLHHKEGLGA